MSSDQSFSPEPILDLIFGERKDLEMGRRGDVRLRHKPGNPRIAGRKGKFEVGWESDDEARDNDISPPEGCFLIIVWPGEIGCAKRDKFDQLLSHPKYQCLQFLDYPKGAVFYSKKYCFIGKPGNTQPDDGTLIDLMRNSFHP